MKMAKASSADLDMAMELIGVLDDIDRGYFPDIFSDQDDETSERLDADDMDQYGRMIIGLRRLLNRGSIGRVIFGMAVVCDPSNECIDPDASTIEHHPKRQQLEKQVEGLLLAETNLRQQVAHLTDQLAAEKSNYARLSTYLTQAERQRDDHFADAESANKKLADLDDDLRRHVQRAEVAERNRDDLKKQSEENHRLFLAAISDLAKVNETLELDPNDGGAEPIISAIDDLKSQLETAETANIRWLDLAREYECKTIPELRVFIGALVERIESLRLVALKTLNGEMPGFGALHKALSEGPFVVRCSGAPAIFAKKLDSAKAKALTLARHNTQTFEVFALVPVGKAVRGAEWRASLAGGNRRHYEERK